MTIAHRITPARSRNELLVAIIAQCRELKRLSDLKTFTFEQRRVMREASGMLNAAVELYRNGTWDRPTIEAWHDAAKLTIAQFSKVGGARG